MRKLGNVLYLLTEGTHLSKEGEAIMVEPPDKPNLRVPIHTLESIVCFGRVGMSTPLAGALCESGVHVSLLSPQGRYRARIAAPVSGNVHLRRAQYRASDDPTQGFALARSIVLGKLANQRVALRRGARDRRQSSPAGSQALDGAADVLSGLAHDMDSPRIADGGLNALRAVEGEAAARYFGAFEHFITKPDPDFKFVGRSRRPPIGRVNSLLSFGYALLAHDVAAAVSSVGLDPQVGFLHADRPGRPGLALDVMEEFRVVIVDRLVLALINRGQIQAGDLDVLPTGETRLMDQSRRDFVIAYQRRKMLEIKHPYVGESMQLRLVPFVQAQLLARVLRGDVAAYVPYAWR